MQVRKSKMARAAKATTKTKTKTRAKAKAAPVRRKRGGATSRVSKGVSAETRLKELKERLLEISDLSSAGAVLGWDHATYMPKAGAEARGRQGALLSRLVHERSVAPALGRLIDALAGYADTLSPNADDARLLRVVRRNFEKATKVPADFVARMSALGSASYDAWTRARPANDFATMVPYLEQILDLRRQYADFFAPYDHVADPLIDDLDEGMTTAALRALFTELRAALVPMVRAIAEQPLADDSCLRSTFGEAAQLDFGLGVAKRFGYDLDRGRLDKTHHPFCTRFASGDVRITTRVRENDLGDALFSTLHETGHALYELGVRAAYEGTPLGRGTSAGVHESQSRLWENLVARSHAFWSHFYPALQRTFPDQLAQVPLDTFYRAINKVERTLIRTDSDEVTYNLHIMLRFELELALLEGRLRIKDVPEAWRAGMQANLGVVPPDDRDGCLQDVHWYGGSLGGEFQGYTIGNILSAQFFAAAVKAHPEIEDEIASGKFSTLHAWLRANIYQHGHKFTPDELVVRATGEPMNMQPYLAYLRSKYGAIYRLPSATS